MLDTNAETARIFPVALAQLRADVAERQQARIANRTSPATYDDVSDVWATAFVPPEQMSPERRTYFHQARLRVRARRRRVWHRRLETLAALIGAGILIAFAVSVLLNLIP